MMEAIYSPVTTWGAKRRKLRGLRVEIPIIPSISVNLKCPPIPKGAARTYSHKASRSCSLEKKERNKANQLGVAWEIT
ncbi:hypothetical protein C0J52_21712 [Blattella germanica]|nr:hypothetical protein C0J52_21712 [Blattella germanica]